MKAFRAGLFGCLGVFAAIIGLVIIAAVIGNSGGTGTASVTPSPCAPKPCVTSKDGGIIYIAGVERNVVSTNPYDLPEAGNYYVRVAVRFGNQGHDELHASSSDFVLQDASRVKHTTTTILGKDCGWDSVNVTTGGSFGPRFVCFEAGGDPKGGLALVWTPQLFGNDYSVALP